MASNPDPPTALYQNNQLPGQFHNQPGVCVVDQQPLPSPRFPIRYKTNSVLVISILKTIIGSSQFLFGVFDILYLSLGFEESNSGLLWAFPVWCGVLVVINGIFGILSTRKSSIRLIGTFLGLSIFSLFSSVLMLGLNSDVLAYFLNKQSFLVYCLANKCLPYDGSRQSLLFYLGKPYGQAMAGFLEFLIIFELLLSISAVIYSSQAFSKCCNTCEFSDAGTCVGCQESDAVSNYQEFNNQVTGANNALTTMLCPVQPVQSSGAHSIQVNDGSAQPSTAAAEIDKKNFIQENIMNVEQGTGAGTS